MSPAPAKSRRYARVAHARARLVAHARACSAAPTQPYRHAQKTPVALFAHARPSHTRMLVNTAAHPRSSRAHAVAQPCPSHAATRRTPLPSHARSPSHTRSHARRARKTTARMTVVHARPSHARPSHARSCRAPFPSHAHSPRPLARRALAHPHQPPVCSSHTPALCPHDRLRRGARTVVAHPHSPRPSLLLAPAPGALLGRTKTRRANPSTHARRTDSPRPRPPFLNTPRRACKSPARTLVAPPRPYRIHTPHTHASSRAQTSRAHARRPRTTSALVRPHSRRTDPRRARVPTAVASMPRLVRTRGLSAVQP
ncbi:hypothetical protein K438DRAFT_1975795 [Mycena galopus ATCC 62051]|nr:hypothetical protein K438DRAFT_1975795 [Mycena galopus ATCC 62051]